jgi:hypothetical protein
MSLWTMTDEEAGKPKYQSDTLRNGQSVSDLDSTYGVGVAEETVTANKAKGMQHAGWVVTRTYTDAQGNTRNKTETLVAAGSMTGDAADDSVVVDLAITIGTQPQSASVTAPDAATFTVAATINGSTPLSYQWQIQQEGAGAWTNIDGATAASYTTGATATGDGVGATDGDKYRVVITAVNGTTVTSSAATLTVA